MDSMETYENSGWIKNEPPIFIADTNHTDGNDQPTIIQFIDRSMCI